MADNHPMVPSSEQIKQWTEDWYNAKIKHDDIIGFVADQAAKWASDEELNACRLWVSENCSIYDARNLSLARRLPHSVSKQSALEILNDIDEQFDLPSPQFNILFQAIQLLPE